MWDWPSWILARLCIAINILWLWTALIRSKSLIYEKNPVGISGWVYWVPEVIFQQSEGPQGAEGESVFTTVHLETVNFERVYFIKLNKIHAFEKGVTLVDVYGVIQVYAKILAILEISDLVVINILTKYLLYISSNI